MAAISAAERQRRDRLYELGLKQCTACDEPKPLDAYRQRSDGYRGLNGSCRDCRNAATLDYQKRNPEQCAARMRRWRHANRSDRLLIERRYAARRRWREQGVAV